MNPGLVERSFPWLIERLQVRSAVCDVAYAQRVSDSRRQRRLIPVEVHVVKSPVERRHALDVQRIDRPSNRASAALNRTGKTRHPVFVGNAMIFGEKDDV